SASTRRARRPSSIRSRPCASSSRPAGTAPGVYSGRPFHRGSRMRWLALGLSGLLAMNLHAQDAPAGPVALVIHGGAGVIERAALGEAEAEAVRADLDAALDAGYAVLRSGGSALDAVEAAVVALEESPRFNAGKGAVFNALGAH